MSDSERKPGFVLPVDVTLAVLLGLYVGAYYSMVKVGIDGRGAPTGGQAVPLYSRYPGADKGERYPKRHHDDSAVGMFFAPAHWLDRRIRPHVREPTP